MGSSASFAGTSFAQSGNSFLRRDRARSRLSGSPWRPTHSDRSSRTPTSCDQQIISGWLDADYTGIVDGWANAGFKTAEFRIGYEFNGFMPWTPASNGSDNADFVKAWQHIANLIHAEGTKDGITAKTIWDSSHGERQQLRCPDLSWRSVRRCHLGGRLRRRHAEQPCRLRHRRHYRRRDLRGLGCRGANVDHYYLYENFTLGNPTPGLGATTASGYGWSFADTVAFAKEHNKPFGIDETGATSGQDDAVFPVWPPPPLPAMRPRE